MQNSNVCGLATRTCRWQRGAPLASDGYGMPYRSVIFNVPPLVCGALRRVGAVCDPLHFRGHLDLEVLVAASPSVGQSCRAKRTVVRRGMSGAIRLTTCNGSRRAIIGTTPQMRVHAAAWMFLRGCVDVEKRSDFVMSRIKTRGLCEPRRLPCAAWETKAATAVTFSSSKIRPR
jgi:hypothetical protein